MSAEASWLKKRTSKGFTFASWPAPGFENFGSALDGDSIISGLDEFAEFGGEWGS